MSKVLKDAANLEAIGIATLVVVLAVSPVIIWLVRNAVATIQVPYIILCYFKNMFRTRSKSPPVYNFYKNMFMLRLELIGAFCVNAPNTNID